MAMLATLPSTIMGAAFGRLHNSARPTVVESIMVDGEAANIVNPRPFFNYANNSTILRMGMDSKLLKDADEPF